MSTPIITFFNLKAGVGKTFCVFNLAWMYHRLGLRVLVADLDPQANLSMNFLGEARLEELWFEGKEQKTIVGSVLPLLQGLDDTYPPHLELVEDQLGLLVGNIRLFELENAFATGWSHCLETDSLKQEFGFRVTSALWRTMQRAATVLAADIILMDVAPNLTAINRAAMIAADGIVVPIPTLDLFALTALATLGLNLQDWRRQWQERLVGKNPNINLELPLGKMQPIGYVVIQQTVRLDRPVKSYQNWPTTIPKAYREAILNQSTDESISVNDDRNCIAILKNYDSLMFMANTAHKAIFNLKPADGAMGAYTPVIRNAYREFEVLARRIVERTELKPLFDSLRFYHDIHLPKNPH